MGEFVFDPNQVEPSLAVMRARFTAVARRVHNVYGLRLPQHMAVFAAFVDCLGVSGHRALNEGAGLSPAGISRYFGGNGMALASRDGLDERLEFRFRRDPAEFVTIMSGDTDGLHYGLWYDDPEELPSFVAHNYARDSGETLTDELPTALAQISQRIDDIEDDIANDPGHEYDGGYEREQLRKALDAFAEADRLAYTLDGPGRWAGANRQPILGGIGPALHDSSGDPRSGHSNYERRYQGYRAHSPQVREWMAEAESELAVGQPAYALVLGRELHWFDSDDYRSDSLRLLTAAYQALGRNAHADLIATHHAHRDLRSVNVLVAGK